MQANPTTPEKDEASPKVFISYRREDSAGYAGWLRETLIRHLSPAQVFMDIDIELGTDIVEGIRKATGACDALIVLIGRQWLNSIDEDGHQHLKNPTDPVHLEIATALDHDLTIIPVLLQGVTMPGSQDLPDSLAKLERYNALPLSDASWDHDTERLIELLKKAPSRKRAKAAAKLAPQIVQDISLPTEQKTICVGLVDHLCELTTIKGHSKTVNCVAFSPDGLLLASASDDMTVKLWAIPDGHEVATLTGHIKAVHSVAFSPDGSLLASAAGSLVRIGGGHEIKLWRIPSGHGLNTLKRHRGAVNAVVFSPDGSTLASSSNDKTVRLWSIPGGQEKTTLKGHISGVGCVAFSPDGSLLASGSCGGRSYTGTVKVWDIPSGRERVTLQHSCHHNCDILSVAFSPDGSLLAAAAGFDAWVTTYAEDVGGREKEGAIELWEMPSANHIEFARLETPVESIAFSSDGTLLATGGAFPGAPGAAVTLWKVATRDALVTLSGPQGVVHFAKSLAFSPDGTLLAFGSDDGTIKVWGIG